MLRRTIAVTAALLIAAAVPQLQAPAAAASAPCGSGVRGDVDGNGTGDLAVNSIRYDYSRPGHRTDFDVIRYPEGQRVEVSVDQLDPEPLSGHLVEAAFGDLNGDGCADLVFAADDANATGTARLYLVPGSPSGLALSSAQRINLPADLVQKVAVVAHASGGQIAVTTRSDKGNHALRVLTVNNDLQVTGSTTITAASLRIKVPQNSYFGFGMSLAASGRTIVVGSPNEKVGKAHTLGAVHLFTATDAAPMTFRHTRITENSPHIPGRAFLASFGEAVDYLDGRLAVGSPDWEYVHKNYTANNAGAVYLLRWNESTRTYKFVRRINQATKGVPDKAESWDRLGYEVLLARGLTRPGSYDVVAASREGIGKASVAGSVLITNFAKAGYQTLTQASAGVPGEVGKEHWFGFSLTKRAGGASDVLVIGALGTGSTCDNGLLIQSSGSPIRTTTWTPISPLTAGGTCPTDMWPRALAR